MMDYAIGASVEAVDQLGIWAKAKVVSKSDNSVVVTFPPWRSEWDREICDPSEIRDETIEETLIPRHLAQKKVRNKFEVHFEFSFILCSLVVAV